MGVRGHGNRASRPTILARYTRARKVDATSPPPSPIQMRLALAIAAALAVAAPLAAQQDTAKTAKPDSSARPDGLPLVPTRNVTFTTHEGTWMSTDVSPDGKTIVFDLVGDLYTLPIGGGMAKRITSGTAFDGNPV